MLGCTLSLMPKEQLTKAEDFLNGKPACEGRLGFFPTNNKKMRAEFRELIIKDLVGASGGEVVSFESNDTTPEEVGQIIASKIRQKTEDRKPSEN